MLLALQPVVRRFRRKNQTSPPRAAQTDLANMMILLQAMRDMLEKQRNLARQLNGSLDKKVAFIKKTVDAAVEDMAALQKTLKATAEQVARLKTEVGATAPPAEGPPSPAPGGAGPSENPHSEAGAPARPPIQKPESDLIDQWVGIDLGGPEPEGFEVPDEVPEEPENAEAAREAFRALLNLEERTEAHSAKRPDSGAALRGNNGKRSLSPLQVRVYEYNDAGMSVPQISRELGIGKGEVRLILSLRKSRR